MPQKRGQNYTEGVNKQHRAADTSATTDSVVQPHPSPLQPVQLQEPSNAARATPQLTLSAEVLATLNTFHLSSSIRSTVDCCTTPATCSNSISSRRSFNICSSGNSPGGAVCSGSHFNFKCRGGEQRVKHCRSKLHHSQC